MGCNFTEPFDHSPPVHHGGTQLPLSEWPDACVWAQLHYERWRQGRDPGNYISTMYLDNLEKEWAGRGICSRCHRDIDSGLDEQMLELESRVHNAEEKLARIRRVILVTPDTALRPELMDILDAK